MADYDTFDPTFTTKCWWLIRCWAHRHPDTVLLDYQFLPPGTPLGEAIRTADAMYAAHPGSGVMLWEWAPMHERPAGERHRPTDEVGEQYRWYGRGVPHLMDAN